MANTRSQRPERASAIVLPPTPANASMITVFSFGADSAMWAAILLELVRRLRRHSGEDAYFAMGSGVTPNHASSVIQMPFSYLSQILNRWNQYLHSVNLNNQERREDSSGFTSVNDREIDRRSAIDGFHLELPPSCQQSLFSVILTLI